MNKMKSIVMIVLLLCMTLSFGYAGSKYDYDIGDPDENFNKKMPDASISVHFDFARDTWVIKPTFTGIDYDESTVTARDMLDHGRNFVYLDYNREVETIAIGYNDSGFNYGADEIEGDTIYLPFDRVYPDENGQVEFYVAHVLIHPWEGHLIHRRTSNVVTLDYNEIAKKRETGGEDSGDVVVAVNGKPSIVEGYIYDKESREYLANVSISIGGDSGVSSSDGYFYLDNVNPGMVSITASKGGYYVLKDHIEVIEDTHYKDVQIIMESNAGAGDNSTGDDESGYVEDPEKAKGGISTVAVIGGAIAGAGLLFFRNGLRKKNRRYDKSKDELYYNNKAIEKELKKISPDYENEYVKKANLEEKQLDEERMKKIKSMKRVATDSIGTTIGKGFKTILDGARKVGDKALKVADTIQDGIDKIKDINLASYQGQKLKVGTIMLFTGDPFSKFTKVKNALQNFKDKNLYEWAKDEIKDLTNVAGKYTDKVNVLKGYDKFAKTSKEWKKLDNITKEVNVGLEVLKNPEMILESDVTDQFQAIRENGPTVHKKIQEVGNKMNESIKSKIKDQTSGFTKDVRDAIK